MGLGWQDRSSSVSFLPDRLRGVVIQKTAIQRRSDNLAAVSVDGMIIFKGIYWIKA
jgi:hypothetical protein